MGRLLNQVCIFLLVLIAPAIALAQMGRNTVSVSGMVVSEGRNQRIEHAIVRLCDGGGNLFEQVITPDSGEFNFRGVQRGRYILTIEANGFQSTEIHLDLSFTSDRGMTVYMKAVVPENASDSPGPTVSAHELSMPQVARDRIASGKKKLYIDKDPKGGLQDFQQAVAAAPGYYEAYCEIAVAHLMLEKKEEAEKSFRKSIEMSGDAYGSADVGLGTLLIERGELEVGEKTIRRGVELNPNSWMGFYELGKLDLNRNRLEDARKSAERARSLSPNTPIVYRLLANIHMRRKDYTAALEDIDSYLKLDPYSPTGLRAKEIRAEIGQELAKQGKASGPRPH